MIEGYKFIEKPQNGEPNLVGTRLTVSRIVRDLEYGNNLGGIGFIVKTWSGRVTEDMIHEAIRYYRANEGEINAYISESMSRSGEVIKKNE